jgi:oxygen-independent coproporphyrinogen-3 oxidase
MPPLWIGKSRLGIRAARRWKLRPAAEPKSTTKREMAAGVYLHIPFCKTRCSYCDFATEVYRSPFEIERYVNALCREISHAEPAAQESVDTIYFGGGTPSLLDESAIGRILDAISSRFAIASDCEITMEMNPATVSPEGLRGYRRLGVNRASFGVQTFDDRSLRLLARGHTAADARSTFGLLREAGFENISFDLIAGLPEQTPDNWSRNLEEAIALAPEHLSLYLLEVHSGTPLAEQISSGRRPAPDEEAAAEMYELMLDRLSASNLRQYEISNFARPGFESRHNLKYWTLQPVYGFGVSAHSFDGTHRFANSRDTAAYVEAVEQGRSAEVFREPANLAAEFVFLGLRLERGISLADFEERFGFDLAADFASDLAELAENGLLTVADGKLQLTRRGKLFSNEVFARFVHLNPREAPVAG